MLPSAYLRVRAKAILEGAQIPKALDRDWVPYAQLVMPEGEEWLQASLDDSEHCLRLCLAAAIAEWDEIEASYFTIAPTRSRQRLHHDPSIRVRWEVT